MNYLPRSCRFLALLVLVLISSYSSVAQTADMPQRDVDLLNSLYIRADVDSAILLARQLTVRYPDDPRPFHAVGRLIIKANERRSFPEAEISLEKCIALHPGESWMTAWSLLSLAYIYFETGRDSLGAAYCEQTISLNATSSCTAAARKLLHKHGRGKVEVVFPITRRSTHFKFHYADTTGQSLRISRSEAAYERAYSRLAEFWRHEPPLPVIVFMYRSDEDIESATGKGNNFAYPDKREIHTTLAGSSGHELTHIFAYYVNNAQTNGVLVEGIAKALDQRQSRFVSDCSAARILKLSPALTIDAVNADMIHTDPIYSLSSSFVYYLLESYGSDHFLALYRQKGALETNTLKVYGASLGDIERSWRARINCLIELTPVVDSMVGAESQKDYHTAIVFMDQITAGYGPTPDLIEGKGQCLTMLGKYHEAIDTLGRLLARKSNPFEPLYILQWAHYYMGKSFAELGKKKEAMHHLEKAIAIDDAENATVEARRLLSVLVN